MPAASFVLMIPSLILYYVSWAFKDSGQSVYDIDASRITQINYAFANIVDNGLMLGDPLADAKRIFSDDIHLLAENIRNASRAEDRSKARDAEDPNYATLLGQTGPSNLSSRKNLLWGNMGQLFSLKLKYRHLKTFLVVGGYTWSGGFSKVCETNRSRKMFVSSALRHVYSYGFDGLDIDWEYPVLGSEVSGRGNVQDASNFVLLLREFYVQISRLNTKFKPKISIAAPCNYEAYSLLNIAEMAPYVESFNLMCYDVSGRWSALSRHHAPLFSHDAGDDCVDRAVKYYLDHGAKPRQLVVGVPFYGKVFPGSDGLNLPYDASREAPALGQLSASKCCADSEISDLPYNKMSSLETYEEIDGDCGAAYSYNNRTRVFISYDSPRSVALKARYVKERQLGGMMGWDSSFDSKDYSSSLQKAMVDGLWDLSRPLETTKNNICYQLSPFSNINRFCHMQ